MLMGNQKSQPLPSPKREPKYFYLALISYFLLLARDAAGGGYRFYSDSIGIGSLWYLPDFLILVLFVLYVFQNISHLETKALAIPLVTVLFSFIGFMTTESLLSVFSAIKMFAPFFVGLYAAEHREKLFRNNKFYIALFALSCAGILWSQNHPFPWINYVSTNEFGVLKTAANQRWIGGVDRLSGFASDSTAAGYVVMVCAIFLMRNLRLFMASTVFLVALYFIYLTTSRTAGVALVTYYLVCLLDRFNYQRLLSIAFFSCSVSFVLFPFVVPLIGGSIDAADAPTWAMSMVDRIQNTWVKPFVYVWDHLPFGFLTGLGLGAVAFPVFYSPVLAFALTCADNFMFANYLMFGFVALWGTVMFLKNAYRMLPSGDLCILISLLVYGITVQGYGVSTYVLFVGLLVGSTLGKKEKATAPPP